MSLLLLLNKNLPRAHTESKLGVLVVHGKLVKYVVHLSKRENWEKKNLHRSCPNSSRLVSGMKEFKGLPTSYRLYNKYKNIGLSATKKPPKRTLFLKNQ
jgi:hypothetical protein